MDPADFKKLRADPVALAQIQARTGHLPPGAPLRQRVWHVEHATDQAPMCMGCGQTAVKWNTKISEYRRFCSPKCAHGHDSVRQKTQQTCLERFGATTNLKTAANRLKQQQTLMEKYGVDNFARTQEFKEKYQATCWAKYGVANTSQLGSTQHDQRVAMPGTRDLAGSWLRPSRMCCVQITV